MDFDPEEYQQDVDQRRELLEEIADGEIALQTLRTICADVAHDDKALEKGILALYETAVQIEQNTLGSGSGQEGRKAIDNLVTLHGEALFDSLLADAKEKEGGADV